MTRAPQLLFLGLTALLSSCGGAANEQEPAQSAKTSPRPAPAFVEPPLGIGGRLPTGVVPLAYALDLDVDPRAARFQGRVRIDVNVEAPTNALVMHGRDLTVKTATIAGRTARVVRVRESELKGEKDEIVFAVDPPLPAGRATLEIHYDAPYGRSLSGLYRARDRDRDYAFTQFEPSDARRAFPCFDQPSFKTPFAVSVTVPRGMIAVANARETAREETKSGTRFVFAPTKPIPTYLVALAVGELEAVSDPKAPDLRVITTKGRAEHGKAALADAIEFKAAIERYLGVTYAYDKLDLVSVPDFGAGAMENPGLITFREELLLADPARPSPAGTRSREHVIAHELAHQWFGNLVTMDWWDDLWLNESFATWLSARVLDEARPQYRVGLGTVRGTLGVMELDALPSARPVRRRVRSVSEALEAFDGMTYEKGAAVIRMLETAVTPPRFRDALKQYLQKHAHATARTEDLLDAVSAVAPERVDVRAIAKAYLEQTGVPTVSVERDCRRKDAAMVLSQYPWAPVGAPPPAQPLKRWSVPICVREDGKSGACTMLADRRIELPLAHACRGWVYPNTDQAAYARLSFAPADVPMLLGHLRELSASERLGLLNNLWAQTRAGELPPATIVAALKTFDGERERDIVEQVIDVLWGVTSVLQAADQPALARDIARARLGPRKRWLGWGPAEALLGRKPHVPTGLSADDAALLRRSLLFALGEMGEDEETLNEADVIARAWLADPRSVDVETAAFALELASRRADATRFDALVHAARTSDDARDRINALRALGAFGDANLVARALDFAFDDKSQPIAIKDIRYVLEGAQRHRRSVPTVLAWTQANWDRAIRRFEGPRARKLIDVVYGLCDRPSIEGARTFFRERPVEGGSRTLDESIAAAERCVAYAEMLAPGLRAGVEADLRSLTGATTRPRQP